MAKLVIETRGNRQIYEILEERITIGTEPDCQLRLPAVVRPLVIERDRAGYRIVGEAAHPPVHVNGHPLASEHHLLHGDRIAVGGLVLEFVDEAPTPLPDQPGTELAPSPPSPQPPTLADIADQAARQLGPRRREERRPERPSKRGRQPKPRRSPIPISLLSGLLLGAAVVTALLWSQQPSGNSSAALLNLAAQQEREGRLDHAHLTLHSALERSPSDQTRVQIESALERVNRAIQRRSDVSLLASAVSGREALEQLAQVYLVDNPQHRPACRELIRQVERWLDRYRDACSRHPDHTSELTAVTALRDRYLAAAQMSEPDTADDVMFAARLLLRYQRKRYRDAITTLDQWLASAVDNRRRQEVELLREEMRQDGAAWLSRRLEAILGLARARGTDAAQAELDLLIEQALPEWQAKIDATRDHLQRLTR